MKRRRSTLLTLGLGGGAPGALGMAAAALLADRWYLFDLLAQFAAPAATLSAAGAVLSAVAFRPRLAAAWLAALGLLLTAMQPQLRPWTPPPVPGAAPVRVYVANLYVLNPEPWRAVSSIARERPDVLALVEVGPRHLRALGPTLARYPHRLTAVDGAFRGGTPRIVVASRFPIRTLANARRDGLAVTEVAIEAPGVPFRLIATHLTRPWPFDDPQAQTRQVDRLARRINAGDVERTLVVGDFNAVPAGAVLRRLSRRASLTPVAAPTGTWPAFAPFGFRVSIDNALAGRALSLSDRRVGEPTGSDHRPIVFEVRPAQPAARATLRRLRGAATASATTSGSPATTSAGTSVSSRTVGGSSATGGAISRTDSSPGS